MVIWLRQTRFTSLFSSLPFSKPFKSISPFPKTTPNSPHFLSHHTLISPFLPSYPNKSNNPSKYPKPTLKFLPNQSHLHNSSSLSFYHSDPNTHKTQNPRSNKIRSKPKPITNPPPDSPQFHLSLSQLPPRFTPQDLCKTLALQKHPLICLQIFNWASQQPRFRHDISTYLITIKKLGSAGLIDQMDYVINQALALPIATTETFFNTIIYFYTEFRKLSKAINVYKLMKKSKDPSSRPSVRTYNLLFAALLSRGTNSYINHMYMETIRCLFKQMVADGIGPDIFSLNSMIKGYVLSLHLNDALRIFHQMGSVYNCSPNAYSYDYLIHGLCAQGRSKNAMELYREMMSKGFIPSQKAYNSLVNCLAIVGEVEEAVRILWEMNEKRRLADCITYRTVLDAICRQGRVGDAMSLLRELQEKDLLGGQTYKKLLYGLQDDYGDSDG
ncbi:tetratricopeptide repeat (TPR)-like superfamily protein [Tasmannia lanceolata]|uniref:tetratricopeptide repeat (TPR)-like superfamily protein n=1 Tax=Tasmannia lanceolata TaxID=3420 RepID=UPI0040648744